MSRSDSGYNKFIDLLHRGESLTYDAIVNIFGCDKRTAERWVRNAQDEGIPLHTGKIGRKNLYSIPAEHRQEGIRVNLTDAEMLALAIGAEAAQSSLGPTHLGSPLHSGIAKLLKELPGDFHLYNFEEMKEQWHFSNTPTSLLDPEVFQQLMVAVEAYETCAITYFTAKGRETKDREIDPYGFAAPKGSWMVVAWCRLKRKFLNFSIADIRKIDRTGKFFTPKEFDLHDHFAGQFGGVGGAKLYNVTFLVEPDRVTAFRRKQYHASQQIESRPDGRAIVRFTVTGLEDMRSFAQSWGTGITVLEPEELVEIMRKESEEVWGRYGSSAR
ncbi:MAG: WYL domain-containing protein [Ignavibacteriae bacterium]|nr:WYL domain-containing protein [Ignavibacteriota bacterium]MCB9216870.1 WYL domain-containing protein [Ignavibacteria bacterium]